MCLVKKLIESSNSSLRNELKLIIDKKTKGLSELLMRTQSSVNDLERKIQEQEKNLEDSPLVADIDELEERLEKVETRVSSFISNINQRLAETFEIPGLIGQLGKFKNFKEFVEYTSKQLRENQDLFESKTSEIRKIKEKAENSQKNLSTLAFKVERSSQNFVEKSIAKLSNEFTNKLAALDTRVNEVRSQKLLGVAELKQRAFELYDKIAQVKDFDKKISENFESQRNEILGLNEKTETKFEDLTAEHLKMKKKFDEMAEFIRDVRFKKNLDSEGTNRKDFLLASHKLTCSKENHDNCFDKPVTRGFNRKTTRMQSIKDSGRLFRPTYTSKQKIVGFEAENAEEPGEQPEAPKSPILSKNPKIDRKQTKKNLVLNKESLIEELSSRRSKELSSKRNVIQFREEGKRNGKNAKKTTKMELLKSEQLEIDPVESLRARKNKEKTTKDRKITIENLTTENQETVNDKDSLFSEEKLKSDKSSESKKNAVERQDSKATYIEKAMKIEDGVLSTGRQGEMTKSKVLIDKAVSRKTPSKMGSPVLGASFKKSYSEKKPPRKRKFNFNLENRNSHEIEGKFENLNFEAEMLKTAQSGQIKVDALKEKMGCFEKIGFEGKRLDKLYDKMTKTRFRSNSEFPVIPRKYEGYKGKLRLSKKSADFVPFKEKKIASLKEDLSQLTDKQLIEMKIRLDKEAFQSNSKGLSLRGYSI